jgi:molybdopterin converting factor small subunit
VIDGTTVREVLDVAVARFGPSFAEVLPTCRVWLNGDTANLDDPVTGDDEVAILPPVSGGG